MSSFKTFELTEQDTVSGHILSSLQRMVIQNDLAIIAEQILALNFDPLNPVDFAQQHAFLKGQMTIYQTQLQQSDECQKLLEQLASSNQPN